MKFELFVARRLQLYGNDESMKSSSFTLNVAAAGIVLAIVVMIVSIAVVAGFKQTIMDKIFALDAHVKITNGNYSPALGQIDSIRLTEPFQQMVDESGGILETVDLVAESPCVIKAGAEFEGLVFKGISKSSGSLFLKECMLSGQFPVSSNDVCISQRVAQRLNIESGDRIAVYFISNGRIKLRKLNVCGIFNTDFEEYDKNYIIGNIGIVQSVNKWDSATGTAIEARVAKTGNVEVAKQFITDRLYNLLYSSQRGEVYQITTIYDHNSSYFAWLELLDANIVVILALMMLVSSFALIAGLLIVVLNRVNMIGILKAVGATGQSIRTIFLFLIQKLVLRSMLWGNLLGFSLILIQKYMHVIKLDSGTYYMEYVPVEINSWLCWLNVAVFVVSLLALLAPSYIISSIKPAKTIRFE